MLLCRRARSLTKAMPIRQAHDPKPIGLEYIERQLTPSPEESRKVKLESMNFQFTLAARRRS